MSDIYTDIYTEKSNFPRIVEQLIDRYRVYAPVKNVGFHDFARLREPSEADLGFLNTRLSPKGLFHPQAERMFDYSLATDDPQARIFKEAQKDFSPQIVLGIRPCDARALRLDDANFDSGTKDPWWVSRREVTTLIGLACDSPCSTCFCTSTGGGPCDTSGLDVLLFDTDDGYVAQILTERGRSSLGVASDWSSVDSGVSVMLHQKKEVAEGRIDPAFDPTSIAQKKMIDLFDSPIWEQIQFACINCGACAFICPTCWCFDIQDEVHGDKGERLRLWDSCMFPLFTLQSSGHNPRGLKMQRVRQRFMHKLKYYQDQYGNGPACVGCGRCVQGCPVNIDIRQVGRVIGDWRRS